MIDVQNTQNTNCSECDEPLAERPGRGRHRVTCSDKCKTVRQRRVSAEREGREVVRRADVAAQAAARRAQVLARFVELESEGHSNIGAMIAGELGVKRQRVHQMLKLARADAERAEAERVQAEKNNLAPSAPQQEEIR